MDLFNLVFVCLFGLCIGSFLSVCIYRVPKKLSVVRPARSFCTTCERQLKFWENIPVLSYLFLKGRCLCKEYPISGRYPLVEVLSAFGAAATLINFGLTPTALVIYLLIASLIVISFIDLEYKIIPNIISFPGMILGLCLGIVAQYTDIFTPPLTQSATDSLIGFLAGGGFFYLIGLIYYVMSGQIGLGGGDIKLTAMLGAILGWKAIIPTIFAASLIGAVAGIAAMAIFRTGRKTEIPFGPWIAAGALLYLFKDIPLLRLNFY